MAMFKYVKREVHDQALQSSIMVATCGQHKRAIGKGDSGTTSITIVLWIHQIA